MYFESHKASTKMAGLKMYSREIMDKNFLNFPGEKETGLRIKSKQCKPEEIHTKTHHH